MSEVCGIRRVRLSIAVAAMAFSIFAPSTFAIEARLEYAFGLGSLGSDEARAVATDAVGNVYLTGRFQGTVDFDPSTSSAGHTSAGAFDMFVLKLDVRGNLVYAGAMGGVGANGNAEGIAVDAAGNVYIVGWFTGTVDFDPGPLTITRTSVGSNDIFVLKIDTNGDLVYVRIIGSNANDQGTAIDVDALGNVYASGVFTGTVDFDPSMGTAEVTSEGSVDAFILNLDENGDFVYVGRLGGVGGDIAWDVAVDSTGDAYFAGDFRNVATYSHYPPPLMLKTGQKTNYISAGSGDIFVFKVAPDGSLREAYTAGDTFDDRVEAITVDDWDNVLATGWFTGTVDFNPGIGVDELTDGGGNKTNVFVLKLRENLSLVYARNIGGADSEEGRGIAVDLAGDVYVTGYFNGTGDFDPGVDTHFISSSSNADAFVLRLNPNGIFIYAYGMGGSGSDWGNGISVDDFNDVHTVGFYQNTVDFDPQGGTFNLLASPNGVPNLFIQKLDHTPPGLQVSEPSAYITAVGPVTYTLTYLGADNISLNPSHITLNTTGDATGNVFITGTGLQTRTVTIQDITGDGSIGITVAQGTAIDFVGFGADPSLPSQIFNVHNGPTPQGLGGEISVLVGVGFIQSGERLVLSAPDGSNYVWWNDGVPLQDEPPRVTGTRGQILIIDPVLYQDAGLYTVVYDNVGAKTVLESPPFTLQVNPAGSLPAAGLTALGLLAGALTLCGARVARKLR